MNERLGAAVATAARLVAEAGGRAYLVGGAVRDELLGRADVKDADLEVFGLSPDALEKALAKRFAVDCVGKSFGVLKVKGVDLDVALPRRETKRGLGHKGFAIESDPHLPLAEAAARRDFTVNAIYRDALTGEIVDPHGGVADLKQGVLRHVSAHFVEDPLRVLRGMQFVARFDLATAPETLALCRGVKPEGLPPERQFEEWKKLLLQGRAIARGLAFLRATGWLAHYPELAALVGCKQDPQWHPEGDVWNHTCCTLDAFARRRGECADDDENLLVGLAVLCHDFGKPATTCFDPAAGRLRSIGHDEAGVAPTRRFLGRLTNEERILALVPPLVQFHMAPFSYWKGKAGDAAIRRLALKVGSIERLARVARADDEGRPPFPSEPAAVDWLLAKANRLAVAAEKPKPILLGRHLLARGFKPGPALGRTLAKCFDAQIEGRFADLPGALAWLEKQNA